MFDNLLENQDPNWRFLPDAPQRSILAHPTTRLLLSQCENKGLIEAAWHDVLLLALNENHEHNAVPDKSIGVARLVPVQGIEALKVCAHIGEIVLDRIW